MFCMIGGVVHVGVKEFLGFLGNNLADCCVLIQPSAKRFEHRNELKDLDLAPLNMAKEKAL